MELNLVLILKQTRSQTHTVGSRAQMERHTVGTILDPVVVKALGIFVYLVTL